MTDLVDVVNFNADASCLASTRWLAALAGGSESEMVRWLAAYVHHGRKVSLGLTGATIADLAAFNPETLSLIDAHHDVFEVVLRPFSHDVALLRSRAGFVKNVTLGRDAITSCFRNVAPFFLPPEFMLTNEQVRVLHDLGVEGVFINASRFKPTLAARIPERPYRMQGVLGAQLTSIPVDGTLTKAYLDSLHRFDAAPWNTALASGGTRVSWRDGESWLFLPDGLAREVRWLQDEDPAIRRQFLRDAVHVEEPAMDAWRSYPLHSFAAWVRELRMLGFLHRVRDIEENVEAFSNDQLALWLQVINSDVLSAVEKDDPVFAIHIDNVIETFELRRSERGFEGEEFLVMLESLESRYMTSYWNSDHPHLKKLRARIACITRCLERAHGP